MSNPRKQRYQRKAPELVIDREFELQLWIKGWSLRDIAKELSANREYIVSHVSVWNDIQFMLREWRRFRLDKIDDMKQAEFVKLNALEREYWDAWERSKEEYRKRVAEKKGGEDGAVMKQSLTQEDRNGDPRYLDGVMKCIDKRCKLLGLDAPMKIDENLHSTVQVIRPVLPQSDDDVPDTAENE